MKSKIKKPKDRVIVPDILANNLTVLICGSALGNVSAKEKAYYAHPANRFWRLLYEVGFTDRLLAPQEYPRLQDYDIGITDLCKHESGLDHQLSKDAYHSERLARIVEELQPKWLLFTALRPARAFLRYQFSVPAIHIETGLQPWACKKTRIFVATSTSPLYPYQKNTRELWCQAASLIASDVHQV